MTLRSHLLPHALFSRTALLGALLMGSLGLYACAPYKPEVVQGNFVSQEQISALRTGMTRAQVVNLLGSPLLTSVFHGNRWDYAFTIRRQGVEAISRRFTVFFNGDTLERTEGDNMPYESEFVSKLSTNRSFGRPPPLQASEQQLNEFAQRNAPNVIIPRPATGVNGVIRNNYPPLE